jgi:hypothetical protein
MNLHQHGNPERFPSQMHVFGIAVDLLHQSRKGSDIVGLPQRNYDADCAQHGFIKLVSLRFHQRAGRVAPTNRSAPERRPRIESKRGHGRA